MFILAQRLLLHRVSATNQISFSHCHHPHQSTLHFVFVFVHRIANPLPPLPHATHILTSIAITAMAGGVAVRAASTKVSAAREMGIGLFLGLLVSFFFSSSSRDSILAQSASPQPPLRETDGFYFVSRLAMVVA